MQSSLPFTTTSNRRFSSRPQRKRKDDSTPAVWPPAAALRTPTFACLCLARWSTDRLDEQRLNAVLEGVDLVLELGGLVRQDGAGDDGARDAAGPPQRDLGGDEDVGNVLLWWCFCVG